MMVKKILWVWILVTLMTLDGEWCGRSYGCLEKERIGLLEIKSLINPNSIYMRDWAKYSSNCCEWYGIECDNTQRRVIRLSLSGARDQSLGDWVLNASLFLPFKELQILELGDTGLVGCSENQGFEVLSSKLRKLEVLYLSENRLNDDKGIISCFNGLSALKSLGLSFNGLTGGSGSFYGPKVLSSRLKKLENLYLSDNQCNDSIFSSLSGFSSLKYLDLSRNQLTVYSYSLNMNIWIYSTGWCELKNLEQLFLSGNNLKGVLPPYLGNLSFLQILDLSDNQFGGNIASSHLSHLPQLEYLSITNNYFQVPISFGSFMNLSNLKFIACDNNELIAAPSFQPLVPKFQLLFFSASNCTSKPLEAGFPNFFQSQYDLVVVDLSHNKFVGQPFPSWLFENNTMLKGLYLRDTSFIGPFQLPQHPTPNLQTVDMSDNSIHGQVARNMCLIFPRLKNFMMANNSLTGCIPPCFGNMSSLEHLDLSNNYMSCELLEHNLPTVGSCSLSFLKLSNNNFKGRLPPSVFNMTDLRYLFLDGNKFRGQVPSTFSLESSLSWLDISNNLFVEK